ncbi:MAG: hypothetical protein NC314_09455 [Roseburia sp.]|nr:hypothetical protein [Ruminococcus sp.]MCM1155885.1 hypothetical protein [Roseburia sp.]MCM1243054.1 hypothetical protein [Roseburia sp.]
MKDESSNVMAFDALYTNNQIQKLKVLLPYIDPAMQKNMAIYIKYMELKYTMDFFRKHPFHIRAASREETGAPDLKKICRELKPYCTESEIRRLEQMESMFQTMEMYQEMSQTVSAMQEMFPGMDSAGADSTSAASMENMLMGMLSPEQKAMFEAFSNNQT